MWNNISNIQAILAEGMLRDEFNDLDVIVYAARDEDYDGKYRAAVMKGSDLLAAIDGLSSVAVDGITITGDGTPGNPLTVNVAGTGLVDSVTDDGAGWVTVDNTDPENPIISFAGIEVDGVTITGTGLAGDPLVANLASPTYTVGLWPELGGYVVWVSPDGKHGLVCETIDQSVATAWYEADSPPSNPAYHSVDGAYFADWRLPTIFELDQYLYPQRAAIGNFDETPSPSTQPYWSSTSVSDPNAWIVDFAAGGPGLGNLAKGSFGFVRSVRSF
jgi:hypothetical protein